MDPLAGAFGAHALAGAPQALTPDPRAAEALRAAGIEPVEQPLDDARPGAFAAVALLADEPSRAGEHAEGVLAAAAAALRPGGRLAVTAVGAMHTAASGATPAVRTFTAEAFARLLGGLGFAVTGQWAPGAARRLGGRPPAFEPEADRAPGLLDAAPRVAALARRYRNAAERSRAFFSSVPRKIVAAAVVCLDERGRLLVVHDVFKQHWTIPGGIVDADEDPRAGAAREAREEAGVEVEIERLLGVFALSWPDRLLLMFGARPAGDPSPRPLHPHEIDAAEWVDLDDALTRIDAGVAGHVRRSLAHPGGTWHGD